MTPALLVATLGGAGRMKPAPGTWGSLVVLPLAWAGPWACLLGALLLTIGGYWAAGVVLADETEDPGWFVADEGVGMLLALAALPVATPHGVLVAFALFRLFDIAKPWPVSWADAQGGAFGVMADDILAGGIAAAILLGLVQFLPWMVT